uniref:Uncharacterized protein n=1 Tax=Glossina palpalis gambiensis TaxID=67801 RepID=A0A1B0APC9_9MUSC
MPGQIYRSDIQIVRIYSEFKALMFPLRFDDNSIKLFNFNLRLMAVIVYVDRLSHTEREVAAPEIVYCISCVTKGA